MLKRPFRRRAGFTLAEVLTSLAIIAVLASVVVPAVKGRIQDGYEDTIIQEFQSLSSAITAYRRDVGHYPPTLTYLLQIPANAQDFCGNTLASTDSAKWTGPYISRSMATNASSYTIAGRDAVQTLLNRQGTSLIYIQILNVDTVTVHDIDYKVDGAVDNANGVIRYTNNGASVAVNYMIPTRPNAC